MQNRSGIFTRLLVFVAIGFLFDFSTLKESIAADGKKKIVMIAGSASHKYGDHEHYAGCRLLADIIHASDVNAKCEIVRNRWPEDDSILDDADTIVIYADGGERHPAYKHMDTLRKQMNRGAGLVCLHYAVEFPKDERGTEFKTFLGGYFEPFWSVNPHWVAEFKTLPSHPITSGVSPFATNDEWYFHMRFVDQMKGVTPILTAIAPDSTMSRPDGRHSGNPDARKAVAGKEPQHVAWAFDRSNGGRSFGFTGGHYHWNWGRPEMQRLVTNAIIWSAKGDVPQTGLVTMETSIDKLKENQDDKVPADFSPEKIEKDFELKRPKVVTTKASVSSAAKHPNLLYLSPLVDTKTSRHSVDVEVNLNGAKSLFLVVTDAGDGFNSDWANWMNPMFISEDKKTSALDLDWVHATTGFGKVRKNQNAIGGPLTVRGKDIGSGIGTHANSVIEFRVPEGAEKFEVNCALDTGGTSQGDKTSVRFAIYKDALPADAMAIDNSLGDQRAVENAVAGLDTHSGVEATLAASEPTLKSLTNIDIDHRGRIWVCEVVNYRKHKEDRPEGDRILILEDTDHDGVTDTSKVFYQGRDIDSALGICVLGNRVLVSVAPNVIEFIDTNGDDVPDSKKAVFTNTGTPQHDHSVHSFVFGPDGKLYFNFGNTGKQLCDAAGKPVKDRWGRDINDSGKPYRQGMLFRCNEDFSDMEVVGNNFRNNYEATIDSNGALWQSDNDDDGNRATRINFVMEFGNYGYTDEITGAGWQSERTGWESTIPQRHWHLNDPGVVPTMYITGAGSPTGIATYEGRLLPEVFWDQIIHCDAGPNVVRAYPTKADGAGYSATVENVVEGSRDRWFRPADVCVAPDGSLFVSDWYDPGVGGHLMGDTERGRLFRIAPPNTKYDVPKYDFAKLEDCIEAMRNPCTSVRYMAWHALMKMGKSAENGLAKLAKDTNPRLQARALWLLSKIPEIGTKYIRQALGSDQSDLRCAGIRMARQANLATSDYVPSLLQDASPAVLREIAVALREDRSEQMPTYWTELANRYDGKDRWMLEALGIAAMDRWDDCLKAWLPKAQSSLGEKATRDIVWRSRSKMAAPVIAQVLEMPSLPSDEVDRFFRALDFQDEESRVKALRSLVEMATVASSTTVNQKRLVATDSNTTSPQRDRIVAESALRLGDIDVNTDPRLAAAVRRYVATLGDDPKQLKIIKQSKIMGMTHRLLELATIWGQSTQAVQSLDIALEQGVGPELEKKLTASNASSNEISFAKLLGLSKRGDAKSILRRVLVDPTTISQVRMDAAIGLADSVAGQKFLIELAKSGKLPAEAKLLIGPVLRASQDESVKSAANELFPAMKTSKANLPPVTELAKRTGDLTQGKMLFDGVATCGQCHMVGSQGKNVGPALTEIGDKLSREAMYVSILDPSAGISHNFEAYTALMEDDSIVTGLLVSETESTVVLKDAKGIERSMNRSEIEAFKKQEKSLMPENLQETMDEQGLVDLIEYLVSLKKRA
jgi:putative membrane-bound dehydrogenase-like protein